MAYNVLALQNITELKNRRGNANPVIATILGLNYPLDESYVAYEWQNTSITAGDDYEVVAPIVGDTTTGRWHRVDNAQIHQVNADWNATSGAAQILNKPVPLQGVKGDKGDKGDPGEQGIQGVKGDTGNQGIQGVQGNQGVKGDPGIKGDTGLQGIQGIQGNQGLQGLQGVKGDTGLKGDTGAQGIQGIQGIQGVAGVNAFAAPVSRTFSKGTAYQATNPAKPAIVTITLNSVSSLSLSGNVTQSAVIVIGPTNAVASGTGTQIAKYSNALSGALTVSLNVSNTAVCSYTINLPIGWYISVNNADTTTGVTILSAFDQVVG